MALKPIIHGYCDPFEVPYYCKKCKFFEKNGGDCARCTKSENGKFNPEVGYSCFRSKETGTDAHV